MKLLITGALGHIGSYVINDLLKLKIKKIILLIMLTVINLMFCLIKK